MRLMITILSALAFVALGFFFFILVRGYLAAPEGGMVVSGAGGGTAATPVAEVSLSTEAEEGKSLFKQNCSACHKLNGALVGPALAGVNEKYAGEEEWLHSWIKNAPAMIKKGDPKAVALYEEWNKQQMQAFPQLSDEEIDNILAYIGEAG